MGEYVAQDRWFMEAKRQGYRARSAFKLMEIDRKFGLIERGMKVLDIGAAPGSFLQYMQRAYGSTCRIVGADIQKIEPIAKEITLIQGDVLAPEFLGQIAAVGIEQFDAVTSDIAPHTTGIRDVDQYESVRLNLAIVEAADRFLKKGGNLLLKVFVGEDVYELNNALKVRYREVKRFKPEACRDRSFEEYFICFGKK